MTKTPQQRRTVRVTAVAVAYECEWVDGEGVISGYILAGPEFVQASDLPPQLVEEIATVAQAAAEKLRPPQ